MNIEINAKLIDTTNEKMKDRYLGREGQLSIQKVHPVDDIKLSTYRVAYFDMEDDLMIRTSLITKYTKDDQIATVGTLNSTYKFEVWGKVKRFK